MLFLDPQDPIKLHLEQLNPSIASLAENCIQTFFKIPCSINKDWAIVERLNGQFQHNICLGCGNDNFQAIAVLGTTDNVIMELINSTDIEDILDAFGEMLNNYFAMLMDKEPFIESFGTLTQSIAQYSSDFNIYPKAWGCNGTLRTPEGGDIYIGFAIKNNPPMTS